MPKERRKYTLAELSKNADPDRPLSEEERALLDMPPVGREFGSGSCEDPARAANVPLVPKDESS